MKLVLTCEHAGNTIPADYKGFFKNKREILETHRGYDPGALDLFESLLDLSDYNYFQPNSRLLVEVNRSVGHPQLFSNITKELTPTEKMLILEKFYYPYRNSVEKTISGILAKGEKVLHFSIHSFTPKLDLKVRNADMGLLYDPSRKPEKEFCDILKQQFLTISPELRVRYNYPYLGIADGFTTYLRKKNPENYLGIELEVNQKFIADNKMADQIKETVHLALKKSRELYKNR